MVCFYFLLLVALVPLGTGWPPEMQFLFACTDGDLGHAKGKILLPRNGVASRCSC
jgi:hypothetical protein